MPGTSPIEIYKALPKTNCRKCQVATCMAFAALVVKGEKRLSDCPYLEDNTIARFEGRVGRPAPSEKRREELLVSLREKVPDLDFKERAQRLGGVTRGGRLVIKCLGKEFEIDGDGNIESQCHTHAWFSIQLLSHVISGGGEEPLGEWIPFRSLAHGAALTPLFEQRCEKPLKETADAHTELFEYLIDIFNGTPSDNFDSDISVVLFPFPKVPVLICYWRPEGELDSQLHIFFDRTADVNLTIETAFYLGIGLVSMFEKIMLKHK